jgi:segregation and condensation protein B
LTSENLRPEAISLEDQIWALLFVADSPISVAELCQTLSVSADEVQRVMTSLTSVIAARGPLQLVELAGGYQLATRTEFAEVVANYLRPNRNRMTRGQLEVLAIVAYQQPVTAAEIDQIRGVGSDHVIRVLVERSLIQDMGRKNAPGRPILYGTTSQFLHQFKMSDLKQLPALAIEETA